MTLLHYLRRVVCFLLIYAMGVAVAHANYNWQNYETLLEDGRYTAAIKQLDTHLESSRAKRDSKEWTLALLRGAKIRTLAHQQGSAINYLIYNEWPANQLSQSILNLAIAREYEAYSIEQSTKAFLTPTPKKSADKSRAFASAQLLDKINHHYKRAFNIAAKNKLSTRQALTYLTPGSYPATVRSNLSDVIAAYWLQFLADDIYWTSQQKQLLSSLELAGLLDLNSPDALITKHPLLSVKKLSQQLIQKHKRFGNDEEVFEVKRFYAQLLARYFFTHEEIDRLSNFLTEQLRQLGSHNPWWTMGQFQLALLQQKLAQHKSLTHIHDLAVRASIIHPDSLGAIRSRELINQLEFSEYTVTGAQTSDLGQPSISIKFRNLQKLFFKAWRTSKPVPTQKTDMAALLAQKADKEWTAILPDQFDLRKRSLEHTPPIGRYGQWLIVASPFKNFLEASSELQLLSMQFSRFVTSVNYFNNEFKVAVYQSETGLPKYNVAVDLLKIENSIEKVLSTTRTDRKGNAILKRQADADYFRIRVGRDSDSSIVDMPSLLSMKNEVFWSKHQAKSLLMTDKEAYSKGDTINWSMISRAEAAENSLMISANANQKAWLRMFDQDNNLLVEKRFTTDASGSASGKIGLLDQYSPLLSSDKSFRIETSWGGQKPVTIVSKSEPTNTDSNSKPSISLLPLGDFYREGEVFSVQGNAQRCQQPDSEKNSIYWSLKRSSTQLDGMLHSYLEIDRGSLSPDESGRFSFKTQLLLGEDKAHRLKHVFNLLVECHDKHSHKTVAKQQLFLPDKKSYYSVLNDQKFFVEGESIKLNLLRNNIRSLGQKGDSEWFIYERSHSKTSTWMRGALKQSGTISHRDGVSAKLTVKQLDSGLYRLRVIPKNESNQRAFEYDFMIAKASVSKGLKLSGVLLPEKTELDMNKPRLRILAGSGKGKQWSRLTITRNNKQLASQMLSPGIHLLTFPINEKHQGGVNFLLEWVENKGIFHREVDLEVPWFKQRLAISVSSNDGSGRPASRLNVLDSEGQPLANPAMSKALLYFSEIIEDFQVPNAVDLNSLYWQSRSSLMRLNNKGKRYPHYFSARKKIPQVLSARVELPHIRYYPGEHDILNSERSGFIIPALSDESQSINFDFLKRVDHKLTSAQRNVGKVTTKTTGHSYLTHFSESFLDTEGGLNIELPKKFTGKQVHLRVIVVTPDLKTGQLSVILR